MLKRVFCGDIVLENEFKRCVYLDTNSNFSRWNLSKLVVSKQREPCFRLDISVLLYMLKCVFWSHTLL